MDPQQQVKEIITLLTPEDPNTTDAVFLVNRYIRDTNTKIKNLQKQIALVEAQLEEERGKTHDMKNEKIKVEEAHKKEKEEAALPENRVKGGGPSLGQLQKGKQK